MFSFRLHLSSFILYPCPSNSLFHHNPLTREMGKAKKRCRYSAVKLCVGRGWRFTAERRGVAERHRVMPTFREPLRALRVCGGEPPVELLQCAGAGSRVDTRARRALYCVQLYFNKKIYVALALPSERRTLLRA